LLRSLPGRLAPARGYAGTGGKRRTLLDEAAPFRGKNCSTTAYPSQGESCQFHRRRIRHEGAFLLPLRERQGRGGRLRAGCVACCRLDIRLNLPCKCQFCARTTRIKGANGHERVLWRLLFYLFSLLLAGKGEETGRMSAVMFSSIRVVRVVAASAKTSSQNVSCWRSMSLYAILERLGDDLWKQ
jgi:hypothetical protein